MPLPPEEELEESFKAPVVSRSFIFSANPSSNRVAQIDGDSLELRVLEAGHEPTYLAPLPQGQTSGGALVVNVRSEDATLFLLPEDAPNGPPSTARVPVHPGANAWTIGASGRFAIAWSRVIGAADSDDGRQDITIIEPSLEPIFVRLSVGYRPTALVISDDETRAIVVSNPGLTIIELGAQGTSRVVREYPLPSVGADARDVTVTPDGKYALIRLQETSALLALDLDSGREFSLPLPGVLTDLDLSRDGTLAVGVIRADQLEDSNESMGGADGVSPPGSAGSGNVAGARAVDPEETRSLVVLLRIPQGLTAPREMRQIEIPGLVGSVSLAGNGKRAVVFSNAAQSSRAFIIDPESERVRALDLRAPIRAVVPAPDGKHAVAVLSPPTNSAKKGAFALVPLDENLPARIEGTALPVLQVAFSETNQHALVTTGGLTGGKSAAYVGGFPNLSVDSLELPSPPIAVGIIGPLGKGFISQEHPEGRITFVDLARGNVTTLTGYELGSSVVE